jgi:polyisoprenyl-phosphate glycosyltransferase
LKVRVTILMPVYRDWECASLVCEALDEKLRAVSHVTARVLLVDDGSPDGVEGWKPFKRLALERVEVLRLRRNIGHQRAICAGLCYVQEHFPCDTFLVMDADGEDRIEDAMRLIELAATRANTFFFAERRKRFEGFVFRTGYHMYRAVHWVLTGVGVRVGNFSIGPYPALTRLTCMSELWNHYAGAVFKSKVAFECVPMNRGLRLRGRSHMNLISLVAHGISGIATFSETVATRILISTFAVMTVLIVMLGCYFGRSLWLTGTIPAWVAYASSLLLVLFVQALWVAFSLVFLLISNRTAMEFVPIRDYAVFVDKLENLPEPV